MTHTAGALAVHPPSTSAPPRGKLRVTVVTETWPPEVNGVATTIARVVEGLCDAGHAVQLVRPGQAADAGQKAIDPDLDELLVHGLPIPRYPHLRMGLPAGGLLKRLWATHPPDVVHIATEGPLGWSALRAARTLHLPVTSDFRTNFHAYSTHYGLGWLQGAIESYLRRFHNATQSTMVPTESLREQLQAAGFQRTVAVARGVDTQRFHPAHRSEALRRAWGAGPKDTVLLCVGRLAPEKNLSTLIAAFEAMRRLQPALKLVLVGDGPERAALAARCPDAVLAGLRSGAELSAHYASGDLMLFPSLTETFGNVTPEALASGLPVLAFDYAAAAQLVRTGVNGALVPMGDNDAFVRQAAAWAADLPAARAMGVAAREVALGHGWDRIVGEVEGVMRSAIADVGARAMPRVALAS